METMKNAMKMPCAKVSYQLSLATVTFVSGIRITCFIGVILESEVNAALTNVVGRIERVGAFPTTPPPLRNIIIFGRKCFPSHSHT